jgi:nucleoside-diphosphate-sugar epimerase
MSDKTVLPVAVLPGEKRQVAEKTMKVLLTGGSGDLSQTLVPTLLDRGDTPVILDVRAPRALKQGAVFIQGSILDRPKLPEMFCGCDCIVHIAAWHGIHEDRDEKNAYDFFDLNVRGTFEVFETAASLGIDKIVFISTTSVYRPDSQYGSSKVLAETIAEDYRKHRDMNVIILRPRGFIPRVTAPGMPSASSIAATSAAPTPVIPPSPAAAGTRPERSTH